MNAEAQETSSSANEQQPVQWQPRQPIFLYKGFWISSWVLESLHLIETHYKPLPTDVLLVSFPKSGTTWLKAITFEILHNNFPNDLLQTHNPHQLIPFLEITFSKNTPQNVGEMPSPRIYSTHLPYSILPENVKKSNCKIIYISRNPADVIVSWWHFSKKLYGQYTLEACFDEIIQGNILYGPLFDHVLEYWEKRERENVFFVTYEDLKGFPNENVKRIAEFLGCSLTNDEIEKIVRKSSFEKMSKLDINTGEREIEFIRANISIKLSSFFRTGRVGDGKKCLTFEQIKKLHDIAHHKWVGSGLESKLLVSDSQDHTDRE